MSLQSMNAPLVGGCSLTITIPQKLEVLASNLGVKLQDILSLNPNKRELLGAGRIRNTQGDLIPKGTRIIIPCQAANIARQIGYQVMATVTPPGLPGGGPIIRCSLTITQLTSPQWLAGKLGVSRTFLRSMSGMPLGMLQPGQVIPIPCFLSDRAKRLGLQVNHAQLYSR